MITTSDIQGLISLAIVNNKQGLIQAMNNTGNTVLLSISDEDLYDKVWAVFSKNGIDGLQRVLSRVRVDHAKVTPDQAQKLTLKFQEPSNTTKFKDWFNNTITFFGDLIGGSSVSISTPTTQEQTASSAISPTLLGLITVLGIILIVIFRKYIAVVVAIIVIVLALVLYGIFAKSIKTITTGGGTTTQSHGGIGSAIIQGLASLFG